CANRFELVIEKAAKSTSVDSADAIKRPKRPQLADRVIFSYELGLERFLGLQERLTARPTIREDAAGLAHEPFVRVSVHRDQLVLGELRQIEGGCSWRFLVRHLVDSP